MPIIQERSVRIDISFPERDVSRKMDIFYNPVMESQRNITVALLKAIPNTEMNIADPLAGSGVRSLRILKELPPGKINHLFVNDSKENFPTFLRKQLALNKISANKVSISSEDASVFLLRQIYGKSGNGDDSGDIVVKVDGFCGYFDYIDLDPFGTPNPFLAAAVSRITRGGILAVTATDTAALTGTYPSVTKRKYWATTQRTFLMHETGLRILMRKVQLQGVQFDKALVPILAYSKDHYYRVFFRCEKGKAKCDELLKQHKYLWYDPKTTEHKVSFFNKEKGGECLGPMWMGQLSDIGLLEKMVKENMLLDEKKFLELLLEEGKMGVVGFYDLHVLAKKLGKEPPKMEIALKKLKGIRTHFSVYGVKTEKGLKEVLGLWE